MKALDEDPLHFSDCREIRVISAEEVQSDTKIKKRRKHNCVCVPSCLNYALDGLILDTLLFAETLKFCT
jgi:hypothetical protein